jgi:hypothetical protein
MSFKGMNIHIFWKKILARGGGAISQMAKNKLSYSSSVMPPKMGFDEKATAATRISLNFTLAQVLDTRVSMCS